jgi:alkylated DNA repair dioxygenase AlkB
MTGQAAGGWQPSLLDGGEAGFDATWEGAERRELAEGAWIDLVPGWLHGADQVFSELLESVPWQSRTVRMYDREVVEPRLVARWRLDAPDLPLPILTEMGAALSKRYGVRFTSVGANLYRDGEDSVAWHGDRVARDLPEATIAIVSLGSARPFRLRPKGGGRALGLLPRPGDLLVMGGSCQRTWDHAIPKVRRAGPRISIQYRHDYDS